MHTNAPSILCSPSLSSRLPSTLASNNLISSTRTNMCHHTHSTILGFNLASSLSHHLHSSIASPRLRLLRLASGKSKLSSAHQTITAYAPSPQHTPLPHTVLSLSITFRYLVFVLRVASSLLCLPSPGDYNVPWLCSMYMPPIHTHYYSPFIISSYLVATP